MLCSPGEIKLLAGHLVENLNLFGGRSLSSGAAGSSARITGGRLTKDRKIIPAGPDELLEKPV